MDKKKLLKTGLTSGLMLVGTLVSTGNVNAEEVKPTETTVTTQAQTEEVKPTEAPTTETTVTTQAPTEEVKPTEVSSETTQTPTEAKPVETTPLEAVEEVHSPDLMSAVDKAKSLDIKVTEEPAVEYKTRAEAKADEDGQIITIDKAIAKKQAMDRERARIIALNTANAEENKAKMEKVGLTYTGDFKKDEETVNEYNKTVKAKYEQAKADYEKVLESNKEIMEKHGLTYTGDATKVNAPKIARWSIQGYNGETNTDANFDNVFLFDDKSGTAEIKVKGTSHGDVTLRFSGITPADGSGFVRSYVALWSAQDGGIGYGVLLSAGEGEANGGGGVDGQGGGSATGDYLSDRQGWIKNVRVEVITEAEDVTDVTINDIDNMQYVTVDNGLDGASLSMGTNMSKNGNVFTANDNDKSDSTSGVLDSNGLGWTFAKGQKIQFSFDHTNTRDDSFSIVGGLFGRASQKKVAPIEIVKAEEPKAEYLKLEPAKDLPQYQEISVSYHKTTVKEEPVIPSSVLPNTGTETGLLSQILGGLSLVLGGVVLKGKKKK